MKNEVIDPILALLSIRLWNPAAATFFFLLRSFVPTYTDAATAVHETFSTTPAATNPTKCSRLISSSLDTLGNKTWQNACVQQSIGRLWCSSWRRWVLFSLFFFSEYATIEVVLARFSFCFFFFVDDRAPYNPQNSRNSISCAAEWFKLVLRPCDSWLGMLALSISLENESTYVTRYRERAPSNDAFYVFF